MFFCAELRHCLCFCIFPSLHHVFLSSTIPIQFHFFFSLSHAFFVFTSLCATHHFICLCLFRFVLARGLLGFAVVWFDIQAMSGMASNSIHAYLNDDVLLSIFSFVAREDDFMTLRLIDKRFCKLIEQTSRMKQLKEACSQLDAIQNHWKKTDLSILYFGHEIIILNETYKRVGAYAINIKCNINISNERKRKALNRTGIVYTTDRWKTAKWIVEDYRPTCHNEAPIKDPYDQMVEENCYRRDLEEAWFFYVTNNGRVQSNGFVCFKIFRYPSWTSWEWYPVWFAIFVEDRNGVRFWDNNGGWNYEIKIDRSEKNDKLLRWRERGWMGT